jgi:uncharacterized membrane protein YhaH (DUF805 family)
MPFGLGFGELVLVLAMAMALMLPVWRILTKAGYSGAWALLIFVPWVNLASLFVFAYLDWPLQRLARITDATD